MGRMVKCLIIVNLLVIVLAAAGAGAQQPQSVPRMTDRCLDKASYVELAREWQKHIDEHGPSPEALVNLGMAHDYTREFEAAIIAARRAVEVGPDSPMALAFLGKMLFKYKDDSEESLKLLERCRDIAPGYEFGLTNLATIYLRRGELSKSDELFKTIFDQQLITRPLQDFAYNMMVGLPAGAVLITNGDNDTFPPLSLQAGKKFRTDVIILNRQLLGLDRYRESFFKRHPSINPGGEMKAAADLTLAHTLIERMVQNPNITVYFASTVPIGQLGFSPDLHLEGINRKAAGKGISTEASARLLLETYRLDSATDWGFAWDLSYNTSRLMSNYVSAMIKLVYEGEPEQITRTRLLAKAKTIAEFHENERLLHIISSLDKK